MEEFNSRMLRANYYITELIDDLNISTENKNKLYSLNEELSNYSKLLDGGEMNFNISYFIKFIDLPLDKKNEIFEIIVKMFKRYSLCFGETKKVDDDNLISFFKTFDEATFWWVDLNECEDVKRLKHFIEDSKEISSDLIKCIIIDINSKLNNQLVKENSIKYSFDYEFDYTDNEFFESFKRRFNKGGIHLNIKPEEFNKNDYIENEVYINHRIVKESIKNLNKDVCYKDTENNADELNMNNLIGLKNVKLKMKQLKKYLIFQKKIGMQNELFLNTIFKGNSGTGKTTVAKIYTKMLFDLGFINENKMISIVPSDFMAHYVGQTQDKTREILDRANGGVLFIDEAYNLNMAKEYSGGSYMREAVVELLKYMEDKKHVVIFSGYKHEMEELLNINPGFKSRIGEIILFDDYSVDELVDIFKLNIKKYNLKLEKKAQKKLIDILEKKKSIKNFGNARYVEKLVNQVMVKHAENVYENEKNIYSLSEADFNISDNEEKESFGF